MTWLDPHVFEYDERRRGLEWTCPANAANRCMVAFKTWPIREPRWNWDGNREKPSVQPSIHCMICGFHATCLKGVFVVAPDSKRKP